MRRSKRTATLRIVTSAAACVAALLWAAPVGAQTWGAKGGLNLSDVTLEDFDTSAEPSAVAGGFYRLPFLAGWTARRRALAATYRAQLAASSVAVPPECDPGHVYHLFPMLTPRRDQVQRHLAAHGIETLVHYPVPIQRQPALERTQAAEPCPVADRVCAEVLSLPLYPSMSDAAAAAVVSALNAFSPAD